MARSENSKKKNREKRSGRRDDDDIDCALIPDLGAALPPSTAREAAGAGAAAPFPKAPRKIPQKQIRLARYWENAIAGCDVKSPAGLMLAATSPASPGSLMPARDFGSDLERLATLAPPSPASDSPSAFRCRELLLTGGRRLFADEEIEIAKWIAEIMELPGQVEPAAVLWSLQLRAPTSIGLHPGDFVFERVVEEAPHGVFLAFRSLRFGPGLDDTPSEAGVNKAMQRASFKLLSAVFPEAPFLQKIARNGAYMTTPIAAIDAWMTHLTSVIWSTQEALRQWSASQQQQQRRSEELAMAAAASPRGSAEALNGTSESFGSAKRLPWGGHTARKRRKANQDGRSPPGDGTSASAGVRPAQGEQGGPGANLKASVELSAPAPASEASSVAPEGSNSSSADAAAGAPPAAKTAPPATPEATPKAAEILNKAEAVDPGSVSKAVAAAPAPTKPAGPGANKSSHAVESLGSPVALEQPAQSAPEEGASSAGAPEEEMDLDAAKEASSATTPALSMQQQSGPAKARAAPDDARVDQQPPERKEEPSDDADWVAEMAAARLAAEREDGAGEEQLDDWWGGGSTGGGHDDDASMSD